MFRFLLSLGTFCLSNACQVEHLFAFRKFILELVNSWEKQLVRCGIKSVLSVMIWHVAYLISDTQSYEEYFT